MSVPLAAHRSNRTIAGRKSEKATERTRNDEKETVIAEAKVNIETKRCAALKRSEALRETTLLHHYLSLSPQCTRQQLEKEFELASSEKRRIGKGMERDGEAAAAAAANGVKE